MTRPFYIVAGIVLALGVSGCATVNGVPQSPCERATRAAAVAHDAVAAAIHAGADPVVIAKLSSAADAASVGAAAVCAVRP